MRLENCSDVEMWAYVHVMAQKSVGTEAIKFEKCTLHMESLKTVMGKNWVNDEVNVVAAINS